MPTDITGTIYGIDNIQPAPAVEVHEIGELNVEDEVTP